MYGDILFFLILLSFNTSCLQPPLPSLLPVIILPPSLLSQIHCSFVSLQRTTGLPGISTKHGLTGCTKTRHKPSYKAGKATQLEGKGPKRGKRVRDTPTPTIRSPTATPS